VIERIFEGEYSLWNWIYDPMRARSVRPDRECGIGYRWGTIGTHVLQCGIGRPADRPYDVFYLLHINCDDGFTPQVCRACVGKGDGEVIFPGLRNLRCSRGQCQV
jgi:hypothetical protein